MWWFVKQTAAREVHVFPVEEEREHILDDRLCNCLPEVRVTISGSMIVHKKISDYGPIRAHWVKPLPS